MERWLMESEYAGIAKKKLYKILRSRFEFSEWHIVPINERPYALEVYKTLNHYIDRFDFPYAPIVEVGCGLGDIISSLKWTYGKIGFDRCSKVLKAARLVHPNVIFYQGTFRDVNYREISCLIMINFIHTIPTDKLKEDINRILNKSKVEMFVLDTFRNNKGTEYTYSHDGNYLFDGKYKLIKRSKGFIAAHNAKRFIEYWKIK